MFSKILTILLGTFLVAVSLKYVKNAWWPIHQGNLRNWRNWALSLAIRTKFKLVLWSMLDRVTSWYYCIKKGTKIMYCTLEESLEPASHSQLFNLLEKLALLVLMVSQWDIQWSVTNNWSWKRPPTDGYSGLSRCRHGLACICLKSWTWWRVIIPRTQ